jgi:hypothetical protein
LNHISDNHVSLPKGENKIINLNHEIKAVPIQPEGNRIINLHEDHAVYKNFKPSHNNEASGGNNLRPNQFNIQESIDKSSLISNKKLLNINNTAMSMDNFHKNEIHDEDLKLISSKDIPHQNQINNRIHKFNSTYFQKENDKFTEKNIPKFKSLYIPKLDEINKKLYKVSSLSESEKIESKIF